MKERASQEELKSKLRSKVERIVTDWREDPAQIAEYLQFSARFPQYSHANTRLLYAQNPNVTFVASASAFRAGLPKNGVPISETPIWIKKGEHAKLWIWKPTFRTSVKDPETGKWNWLSHLSKENQERAKAENWEIYEKRDFVLVPVYDISQMNFPQELYPQLMGYGQEAPDSEVYFRAARAYAVNELQCTVRETDVRNALVRGVFFPSTNEIQLSDMLRGDGRLSTLLHEIGHAELHADTATADLSTAQKELEADMYALMLEQTMGVPTTDARKAHLSGHYKAYLKELQKAAEEKPLSLGADSPPFDNVIRRYRQQLPKIEKCIELAKEATLQEAAVERAQRGTRLDTPLDTPRAVNYTYSIYQLKEGEETRKYRFEPLGRLRASGLKVERANYDAVYAGPLSDSETLEDIYRRFNLERPSDFTGHSLSVSDIVVLQRDGIETAYYCDNFGFEEVPEFLQQRQDVQSTQETPTETTHPQYDRTSNLSF